MNSMKKKNYEKLPTFLEELIHMLLNGLQWAPNHFDT